ncbi:hypothetical protein [Pararhodobacter zhoushanensis]|uniref:Uncharacterized protein n=1 Tax=Pararhodobacter zhoushanensis TaxID=2479545 RepID=A0ABT3H143_9RHOB|nr:hypothetical protein [Pararhodobacter zhoushanensis]MCW1933420.1 hypothetical protein [Pararhodobacter zhoushanensis]
MSLLIAVQFLALVIATATLRAVVQRNRTVSARRLAALEAFAEGRGLAGYVRGTVA